MDFMQYAIFFGLAWLSSGAFLFVMTMGDSVNRPRIAINHPVFFFFELLLAWPFYHLLNSPFYVGRELVKIIIAMVVLTGIQAALFPYVTEWLPSWATYLCCLALTAFITVPLVFGLLHIEP